MKNNNISNSRYFKSVHSMARKFFSALLTFVDLNILELAEVIKDLLSCKVLHFYRYFKFTWYLTKKIRFNNYLRLFTVYDKKVLIRKKVLGKKFESKYDSNSQKTIYEMLFLCMRFFSIEY